METLNTDSHGNRIVFVGNNPHQRIHTIQQNAHGHRIVCEGDTAWRGYSIMAHGTKAALTYALKVGR
jgi:hypothetical protein